MKLGLFSLLAVVLINCGGGSGGSSGGGETSRQDEPVTFSIDTNADEDPFTVDATGFIYHPEQPKAPGLEFIRQCASTLTSSPQCNFSHTQLIRHTAELDGRSVPSVDDVMLHTIASHEWMLRRFEFALNQMPEDIRRLLGGVTAIVIGSHIRPSFYTASSGAIYLDSAYLWTTREEKATIAKAKDFRSEYARELQFVGYSNYFHSNGQSARSPGSINDDSVRTPESIVLSLAGLLFHELAHSNDFFPPVLQPDMNRSTPINQVSDSVRNDWASSKLNEGYPLLSDLWKGLGQVMYRGEDATTTQKALTAEEVGIEFESDLASDDYSYSSIFEDSAMLFEEVMMRHHFGLDRFIAFLEPIKNETTDEEEFWVRWGQRNRAGDERLRSRIRLLLEHFLPDQNPETYIQSLTEPDYIPNDMLLGESWREVYSDEAQNAVHTEKSRLRLPEFEIHPDDIGPTRHSGWSH